MASTVTELLRRRIQRKKDNVIYTLTNHTCDGTTATVINTGLKLFDGSIPNWQMDLEATWASSTIQDLATILDAKIDANPYPGMIVRYQKSRNCNSCGFGPGHTKITQIDGNVNISISYYGGNIFGDNSNHFTMRIKKIGNRFEYVYNDTDWWIGNIIDYTHSKNLYIGANNSDNVGTTFRRFFTGTINSLKITKL